MDKDFQEKGYKLIPNALGAESIALMANYYNFQLFNKGYYVENPQVSNSKGKYSDLMAESMLLQLKPLFEDTCGEALYPAYSYARMYFKGSELIRHIDRPSCEISGTLTISYEAKDLWPIWVRSQKQDIEIPMEPGDLVIYKGCEIPHWREPFKGKKWMQVFLHYVKANGEYKSHKFDKRPFLGIMNNKK